jgi:hypothetical protein
VYQGAAAAAEAAAAGALLHTPATCAWPAEAPRDCITLHALTARAALDHVRVHSRVRRRAVREVRRRWLHHRAPSYRRQRSEHDVERGHGAGEGGGRSARGAAVTQGPVATAAVTAADA